MWEVVAALIGGAVVVGTNALILAFYLGGLKERVNSHGDRILSLETKVDGLTVDFAAMKGERA